MKLPLIILALLLCSCRGLPLQPPPQQQQAAEVQASVSAAVPALAKSVETIRLQSEAGKTIAETQPARVKLLPIFASIQAGANDVEAVKISLQSTLGLLDELKASQAKLAADFQKMQAGFNAEKVKRTEAEAKYDGAWLGGRAWRLIGWITGVVAFLLLADALLYMFTDFPINPITWVLKLIGKLFSRKS